MLHLFHLPETLSQYRRFRRTWSTIFISTSLVLVVLGMIFRLRMLNFSPDVEFLRILPAAILAVVLALRKSNRKIYRALIRGDWVLASGIFGCLLIAGNHTDLMHTPLQTIAQLFLIGLLYFSFESAMDLDASLIFSMVFLYAVPLVINVSVPGILVCLTTGLMLYGKIARGCRLDNPQWRLSTKKLVIGLAVAVISILIAVWIHLPLPQDEVSPVTMMKAARSMLRLSNPLGQSQYRGIFALDGYPINWNTVDYFGAVVAHRLGWIAMTAVFAVAALWLASGTCLCICPAISIEDALLRFVSKPVWAALAIPMVLFLLQNLGIVPHLGVEAPLLTRNVFSQVVTTGISYLLVQSGPAEAEIDPRDPKPDRENTYTITVVGDRLHDRRAA